MSKQKRSLISISICLLAFFSLIVATLSAWAADAVEPVSAAVVSKRGEAVLPLGTESYYRSSTLRLTNCVAYAGTDTSTTQGLDGVTVEVRIGREGTNNVAYTGTVVEASSGSWWGDVTVPDSDSVYLQLKLTDTNSVSYIYPWKIIRTKEALQ